MRIRDKLKWLKDNQGSYVVEASVTLPLIILAIVTIAGLISVEQTRENIYYAASDELRYSMIASYVYRDETILPARLEKRLKEENKGEKIQLKVKGFFTGTDEGDTNDLIKFYVYHNTKLDFPLSFRKEVKGYYKFAGRKWTGDNMKKKKMGYDAMERTVDNNIAYVFPQTGEKYHKKECSHVTPQIDKIAMSPTIKVVYQPCELCNAEKIAMGKTAYIFPDYGTVYHDVNCQTVKKK